MMRLKNCAILQGLFFFAGIFLLATHAYTQSAAADSLLKLIPRAPDTAKFRLYNQSADMIRYSDNNRALQLLDSAQKVYEHLPPAIQPGQKFQLGMYYAIRGLICFRLGKLDDALNYDTLALKVRTEIDDKRGIGASLSNLGVVYDHEGNFTKAIECHFNALKIREEMNDTIAIASSYGNIGEIYREQKEYADALSYYQKSMQIALAALERKPGDKSISLVLANAYNNIGLVKQNQNDFNGALEFHRKALQLRRDAGEKKSEAASLNNIGLVYAHLGDTVQALACHRQSLAIKRLIGDRVGTVASLINMAALQIGLSQFDSAETELREALTLAEKSHALDMLPEVQRGFYEMFQKMGKADSALVHYKSFIAVRDSLFNIENAKKLLRTEMNNDFQRRQEAQKLIADADKRRAQMVLWSVAGGLALVLIFSIALYNRFRLTQKQKLIIEMQRDLVEEKNKDITDSINYAKKIQNTLLANERILRENLRDHFVLFMPKDIVSGDFYWASVHNDNFYLAVCDSTGHGVPGAFMSLLNVSFLNEAIAEKKIEEPDKILEYVRARLIGSVSKDGMHDGMDGILLRINRKNKTVSYAAAHNSPVLIHENALSELPSDKMPIGEGEKKNPFALHTIHAAEGDMLYLFTDGYADQFGGPKGKKFKYKQLHEKLLELHTSDMATQRGLLEKTLDDWRGNISQVDDICLLGIRF